MNTYFEYFVLYEKKLMTFITSFQIFVLCCLSMQHCFCLLATVTTVSIATKVGIASMVGTVSIVGTVSMIDTLFTVETF